MQSATASGLRLQGYLRRDVRGAVFVLLPLVCVGPTLNVCRAQLGVFVGKVGMRHGSPTWSPTAFIDRLVVFVRPLRVNYGLSSQLTVLPCNRFITAMVQIGVAFVSNGWVSAILQIRSRAQL